MDVAALHRLGRETWPDLDVPIDAFEAYVAQRSAEPRHGAELYLTCACARGDERAVAGLECAYFPDARRAVSRVTSDPAQIDEALQVLREKLFVSAGRPPEITGYAGRGDLRSWLRVAATRVALNLLRGPRDCGDDFDLLSVAAPEDDPELALIRHQYGAEANAALQAAFSELSPRERNALRQHYVDGLGIDQLGLLYGVHRSTAARWLEKARATLEKRTRSILMRRLAIGPSTVDSLVAMLQSELHISLSGV